MSLHVFRDFMPNWYFCFFVHVQLFRELLDSMSLGNSKDGADFVCAEDVCCGNKYFNISTK